MLNLACRQGELEGLVPHLIENGLSHLQYADDTVIFIKNSQISLRNLKFILFCYEAMSGMKINYEKSEVFVVGIEETEHLHIAEFFGCKVGVWPMTYLGMPVSVNKITKSQLNFVADKAKRRLGAWKGDTLSTGGKAVLLNSCLSSIPMYTMGVYLLYERNYQALDAVRKRFFWQGTNKKHKYHMVKWEALIRPKEFGGAGFMDIRAMNICFLVKWIERVEKNENSICVQLLCKKYLGDKSIFQLTRNVGSQFWKGLLSVRQWCQRGRRVQVRGANKLDFGQICGSEIAL